MLEARHDEASIESRANHPWRDYLLCRAKGWTYERSLLESGLSRQERNALIWPNRGNIPDEEMQRLETAAIRIGARGDLKDMTELFLKGNSLDMAAVLVAEASNPKSLPSDRIRAADKALQRAGVGVDNKAAITIDIRGPLFGAQPPQKPVIIEQVSPPPVGGSNQDGGG